MSITIKMVTRWLVKAETLFWLFPSIMLNTLFDLNAVIKPKNELLCLSSPKIGKHAL